MYNYKNLDAKMVKENEILLNKKIILYNNLYKFFNLLFLLQLREYIWHL